MIFCNKYKKSKKLIKKEMLAGHLSRGAGGGGSLEISRERCSN
jgi:hypothetical protein